MTSKDLQQRLFAVGQRIESAATRAGRAPGDVRLLAVSKTFPAAAVAQAVAAGQRAFGENYVQEGVEKIAQCAALGLPALDWHFIGPLQSNKTRLVAEHFDWVHSVDRLKIAQRLSEQRPADRAPLQLLIQVNVDGEATKSGCAPDEVPALAQAVAALPRVQLRGLMCIPDPARPADQRRAPFARLRMLLADLNAAGLAVDTLSMGMSDDLEDAVAEGATLVRVGSAIFGARAPKTPAV
ncbi:MAG TPA: YggS family pyridoxal phosphate-dependent enzyme [Burkholderiaceae bacterium]|nr:YggS family pyridoxal phosphate-dependent enzyme [Burkholderiaceae bacterium]